MAIHFPESNLRIMDYNRVLKTLNGMSATEFLEKVAESYEVIGPLDQDLPRPTQKGECSLFINN
jgi:uncharacterized protein (DUF1015 family)